MKEKQGNNNNNNNIKTFAEITANVQRKSCNVTGFYHVTFRFGERISTMKSSLLAARWRILHFSVRVTRILVLFTYFFWYFSFSCERKLCGEHKARRRTAFQLATFPSALGVCPLIVGRFAIATTQPPTSAEDHRL